MPSRPLFDPPRSLVPRRQTHHLKRLKIREISAVDAPACPGAEIILMKGRSADGSTMTVRFEPILFHKVQAREDLQPVRTVTKAEPTGTAARERFRRRRLKQKLFKNSAVALADPDAIVSQAMVHAPVASESYGEWLQRVFRGTLSGFDLKLAKAIYDLLIKAVHIRATAAQALEKMARTRAAETGETFEKAYRAATSTHAGSQLYELSRAKLIPPPPTASNIAKRAADELDAIATRIVSDEQCSPQQAFTRAAERLPDLYRRSRNGR